MSSWDDALVERLKAERDRYREALELIHNTSTRVIETTDPAKLNTMWSYVNGITKGALGLPLDYPAPPTEEG